MINKRLIPVAFLLFAVSLGASEPESIVIESSDGLRLHGEVYAANKPGGVILLFHQGGGSSRGEYAPIAPRLVEEGYTSIAVDLRAGGSIFEVENRTVAQLDTEAHYCEAWPDMLATLDYARKRFPDAKIVAWGSSFSAALVLKLASEEGSEISGALAFSPASGGPMKECGAGEFVASVKVPTLALRPKREAEIESVRAQLDEMKSLGFETWVADPGVHGSSMLVESRSGGSTEETWGVVLAFLEDVTR